jgi:hypothetical protein
MLVGRDDSGTKTFLAYNCCVSRYLVNSRSSRCSASSQSCASPSSMLAADPHPTDCGNRSGWRTLARCHHGFPDTCPCFFLSRLRQLGARPQPTLYPPSTSDRGGLSSSCPFPPALQPTAAVFGYQPGVTCCRMRLFDPRVWPLRPFVGCGRPADAEAS